MLRQSVLVGRVCLLVVGMLAATYVFAEANSPVVAGSSGSNVVATASAASAASAPVSVPSELSSAVKQIADLSLSYAGVLVAASTVAMAFVELFKAITDLRRRFQSQKLELWLGSRKQEAMPELLYLAIGDKLHSNALCGQPIEKMMGQIQAAARIALDYPDRFPNLYAFLTTSDIESASVSRNVSITATEDREKWRSHAAVVHDVASRLAAPEGVTGATPPSTAEAARTASDAAQARARLASLVARKLDGFQLETDFVWSRLNQMLGIVFSIIIVEVAVFTVGIDVGSYGANIFITGLLGIVGGLLAPFAKDFSQSLASFASK